MKPFRSRRFFRTSRVFRPLFRSLHCAPLLALSVACEVCPSRVAAQVTAATATPTISTRGTVGIASGFPFVYQIQAGNAPVTYAATGLPRGLTCDVVTGTISGVTAEAGNYSVSLRATNSIGTDVATQAMLVEGVAPIEMPLIRSVTPPEPGRYRPGDALTIVVEVDAPYGGLVVSGAPRIALTVGAATRFASYQTIENAHGTRPRMTFRYVVAPEDEASAEITVANAIELNGGSIRDRMGLFCTLGLPDLLVTGVRTAAGDGARGLGKTRRERQGETGRHPAEREAGLHAPRSLSVRIGPGRVQP